MEDLYRTHLFPQVKSLNLCNSLRPQKQRDCRVGSKPRVLERGTQAASRERLGQRSGDAENAENGQLSPKKRPVFSWLLGMENESFKSHLYTASTHFQNRIESLINLCNLDKDQDFGTRQLRNSGNVKCQSTSVYFRELRHLL